MQKVNKLSKGFYLLFIKYSFWIMFLVFIFCCLLSLNYLMEQNLPLYIGSLILVGISAYITHRLRNCA